MYVCQLELDVTACTKRNTHHRSEIEIQKLVAGWEPTPSHFLSLDSTSLIQSGCISEVEMEEVENLNDCEQDEENQVRLIFHICFSILSLAVLGIFKFSVYYVFKIEFIIYEIKFIKYLFI